jgi:hypothetical protein
MAIIEAIRNKDNNDKKFLAAVNGVDLEEEEKTGNVEDLNDKKSATEEGFGINEGLDFMQMEVDEQWQE